jgi:hypothetical protein
MGKFIACTMGLQIPYYYRAKVSAENFVWEMKTIFGRGISGCGQAKGH